ncbi:MAG: winged helix-turn-helix domain-containing protein, partial [Thermodesulfobacteriota bacterium]
MQLCFASFRLDPGSQRLWRGDEPVALTRKAFGVLHCLAERAGELVTKDELLERVWPDTVVGDAVLKVCVREIRRALDDDPQEPRFIATAHRRGYRFVAPVEPRDGPDAVPGVPEAIRWQTATAPVAVVGREAPLAELRTALATARAGRRQVVFVTGEAGIGKTTLVDLFLTELQREPGMWIARGQCAQQHGPGEAYMPLLDALGTLCRGRGGESLAAELARRAREEGRVDLEVRALVHQATVVYLARRAASAALFRQAQERVRELPDPALAIHLKSFTAYGRLRARGFRESDRAACAEAVRVLAAAGERSLLVAHYGKSASFENVAGEYAAARRLAEDGLALAVETGDLAEHLLCQYARAWALLHAGAWGEMQRGLAEEIELTERNRHPLWTAVYRLELAWLCIEAFAFERAERLCLEALACGREAGHALSRTLGSILLATARLGRGDADAAEEALREIDVLARAGSEVEWPLRPRLALTYAELGLARGDLDRARTHADALL